MDSDRQYSIKVIDAEAEVSYDNCFYESDTPSVNLKLTVKEMTLSELLESLTDSQLRNAGLQRIPKKGKK